MSFLLWGLCFLFEGAVGTFLAPCQRVKNRQYIGSANRGPAVLEKLAVLHVISSAGVFNAPSTARSHINFYSSHIPPLGLVLCCLALSVHNGFFSMLAGPQALKQRIGPYVPMYFSLCFNLIISPFHGSVLGRFSFHIFPMQAAHCINASDGTLSQETSCLWELLSNYSISWPNFLADLGKF